MSQIKLRRTNYEDVFIIVNHSEDTAATNFNINKLKGKPASFKHVVEVLTNILKRYSIFDDLAIKFDEKGNYKYLSGRVENPDAIKLLYEVLDDEPESID